METIPSVRQQLHQPFVDKEDFLAGFDFGHEAGVGEVVEVAGGGDAVAEAGFLEVPDFAVGADEELLDEFPRRLTEKRLHARCTIIDRRGGGGGWGAGWHGWGAGWHGWGAGWHGWGDGSRAGWGGASGEADARNERKMSPSSPSCAASSTRSGACSITAKTSTLNSFMPTPLLTHNLALALQESI